MNPSQYFRHCPRCGVRQDRLPDGNAFVCSSCNFTFYLSAAIATAVFIVREDGRALFIRRAKEPSKGKLAPPGGFVDLCETAEDGARREVREEVGLELANLTFLCSAPNEYLFKDVRYPVLDFFFVADAVDASKAQALDDVDSFAWLAPDTVDPEELAFPSMQVALAAWRTRLALR